MTTSYLKLAGGYVYDPLNGVDGQVQDIWILDDKIVEPPGPGLPCDPAADPAPGGGQGGGDLREAEAGRGPDVEPPPNPAISTPRMAH